MSNAGIAPFYYLLTLNAKAVDATTGSPISTKSISVPISNQLDQNSFVYYFDMAVETSTSIQFSTWLNSSHLVGNQTIVFAISGASASGVIQLPPVSIGSCTTQSSSVACVSYIAAAETNGSQGTSYTTSPDSSVFNDPCVMASTTTSKAVATNDGTSMPTNIIVIFSLGALGIIVSALVVAAFCAYRILLRRKRQAVVVTTTSVSYSSSALPEGVRVDQSETD
jgi:hypothetical protein